MTFSEFITEKYIQWRGKGKGNEKSQAKYARDVIHVSPQLLSDWMNRGKLPTEKENIEKLLVAFPSDHKLLFELLSPPLPVEMLPSDVRAQLIAAMWEVNATIGLKKLDPDSPEGREQVLGSLKSRGIDFTTIE